MNFLCSYYLKKMAPPAQMVREARKIEVVGTCIKSSS